MAEESHMERFSCCVQQLAHALQKYSNYLESSTVRVNNMHPMLDPARSPTDVSSSSVERIEASVRSAKEAATYCKLQEELDSSEPYQKVVFVNDFAPTDRRGRYHYMHGLRMPFAVEVFQYEHGNNLATLSLVWRAPSEPSESNNNETCKIIDWFRSDIPVYHTRAMRRQFVHRYSLLTSLSPAMLTEIYQHLTSGASAMPTKVSQDLQTRLRLALDSQDPDLVYDLRTLNEGRRAKYDDFWKAADAFINRQALAAVEDRHHGLGCHMALALSIPDYVAQVAKTIPPGSPIPTPSWVRLQFYPKNPFLQKAAQHTGELNVKFIMIQARLLSHDHIDGHYCSALFRYIREFAIRFRDVATLACLDDKHQVKVGEPGYPVAAVNRGKSVIVNKDVALSVGDHDFTKCKVDSVRHLGV